MGSLALLTQRKGWADLTLTVQSHHRPILFCLPLSTSISPEPQGRAQNTMVVSRLLTSLSQSSVQMPRGMEGWDWQQKIPSE